MSFGPYASSFSGKDFSILNTDCAQDGTIGDKWLLSLDLKHKSITGMTQSSHANIDIDDAFPHPSHRAWFKEWAKQQLEEHRESTKDMRYC